ncbi:endolytic transglycosylase MltG [Clostridium oryzae]|uniref:Endolytic murein transglycosylase n=1 Tax=Clostridium oryzae TaxID=1450648 RepID=A0A1V4IUB1_9CLOT|nr:endolytic transglycosylase MltG [Clostridium oryzae]OPJ63628.1 putative aminodeoxychorismate lyase [Clostridium oryzae]
MIKKLIKTVIIFWLLIMILVLGGMKYYKGVVTHPLKNIKGTEKFEIKQGYTLNNVLNSLSQNKKMKNLFIIKYYISKNNLSAQLKLKPGVFKINDDMDIEKLLASMNKTKEVLPKDVVKITIPEGFKIDQIAAVLEKYEIISKTSFIKSIKHYKLPSYIKKDTKRKYALEGYLFPSTYNIKKGASGESIIKMMLSIFEEKIRSIEETTGVVITSKKMDNIITMASVIEGEAKEEKERKIISSVFYNRLKRNMKLESCATVQYAIGKHKADLKPSDYRVKSAYNTYLYAGLPEGPICNPGEKSIEAAAAPDKTNYLYFVSENNGSHYFSRTYSEHLRAVRKYQDK